MRSGNTIYKFLVMILLFSFALFPVLAAEADIGSISCMEEIRVMPLGDSITTGKYSGHNTEKGASADDIGYRKDLWDMLKAAGFNVDFVGTMSNGSAYPFSDPEHEGHNGYTDVQIAENIYNFPGGENWLSQNPPDVILLHIGTNELGTNPSDVERILDEIDEYETDSGRQLVVILARIIDWVPINPAVNTFNNNVETMVKARPDFGSSLFMVDMQEGAGINYSIWPGDPDGDMIDDLHPYATGYTKMAAVWMAAFQQLELCQQIYVPIVKNISGS